MVEAGGRAHSGAMNPADGFTALVMAVLAVLVLLEEAR
jgi:hypothetical protein